MSLLLLYHGAANPVINQGGETHGYLAYSHAWMQNVKRRAEKKQEQAAIALQDEIDAKKALVDLEEQKAIADKADKASRKAMRRSIDAAIKAVQEQLLINLKRQLITEKELQLQYEQDVIDDENDALVALLLTI